MRTDHLIRDMSLFGKVEEAFTIEKSNGTRVTISKRADGQIAVESSSNNCTMIIPPDLFCREIGV